MIFVLGKSGSGKSTLLNILGGLDNATSGEVLIDGNRFSSLTPKDQDNYRNQYVGFIFQDFCLIDGFTVTDNVRLSLDLLGQEDQEKVNKLICDVGLDAERRRRPKELSGGQCQRVAIARALAKSPRILLADEPTGNLDSKTAKQIITLLKELSKDRLVVVVSHNASDAENYADRIIELADGKIIRDVERSESAEAPLIENNVITLPRGKALTESELATINEKITEHGVKIVQAEDPFVPTREGLVHPYKPLNESKGMKVSSYRRLTKLFFKGGSVGTVTTAMILTILALLLCFAQCFALFDSAPLISDALENIDDQALTLYKGYYSDPLQQNLKTEKTVRVTDEDIAAFYGAGYEGNIYPLYTTLLAFDGAWDAHPLSTGELTESVLGYVSPYARSGKGVLITNEEFIADRYGHDGKLNLLAGEISDHANNNGILISDYAADCILFYYGQHKDTEIDSYQAIVDSGFFALIEISGVFETGYRERHANVLAQYNAISQMTDEAERRAEINKLMLSEDVADFVDEVEKYLSIGYYLGDNSYDNSLTRFGFSVMSYNHNTDIYNNGDLKREDVAMGYGLQVEVSPGTALAPINFINTVFGTNFKADGSDFTPIEMTLVGYENAALDTDEPIYALTVLIVGTKDDIVRFSAQDYETLCYYDNYPYALYFDNAESAMALYDFGVSRDFYTSNAYIRSVNTVTDIVEIFRDIFLYIAFGIALVSFVLIVSFSLRSLRRKMREIGIMRALGAKMGQIVICFILQMAMLWLSVVLLSFPTVPMLAKNVNALLVDKMAEFLNTPMISTLTVISASSLSLLMVLAVFLPVLLLSLLVPLLFVRRVRPIKIIRSSDS